MSFASPLLLLSLLALPLAIAAYVLAGRRKRRYAVHFTNLDVLASVVAPRAWRRHVAPLLLLAALAALGVALARPHVTRAGTIDRATVILVIDASGSMSAHDVRPTRLAAAQAAVRAFVAHVPKNVRVGLIVFAGEPQVAAPPSTDRTLLLQSVDDIGQYGGFGGTAIGDALGAAVTLGLQSIGSQTTSFAALTSAAPKTPSKGAVTILFLSDGAQTRGDLSPQQGAQRAKAAGIPVFTVALGTPGGTLTRVIDGEAQSFPVPPDPRTLHAIASVTGGRFFAARSSKTLQTAYSSLGKSLGRVTSRREVTDLFVLAAAGLLAGAGLVGARWSARLP